MEKVAKKLIQFVRETGELPSEFIIDSQTKLSELGVNSITFMKVIILAEEAFGIDLDDDDLDYRDFDNLGELITYIEHKCDKQP
jgi:acyl carrier protein